MEGKKKSRRLTVKEELESKYQRFLGVDSFDLGQYSSIQNTPATVWLCSANHPQHLSSMPAPLTFSSVKLS